jgi:hypothetical protein
MGWILLPNRGKRREVEKRDYRSALGRTGIMTSDLIFSFLCSLLWETGGGRLHCPDSM